MSISPPLHGPVAVASSPKKETPSHISRLHTLKVRDGTRISSFRGVHYSPLKRPHRVRWSTSICEHGRVTYLGAYDDERLAAVAYDLALMIHGYLPVNFSEQFYSTVQHHPAFRAVLRNVERRLQRTLTPPHDPDPGSTSCGQ